ncbi:XF1762 family protein [Nocardioides sp.]|uniref:XF1762 family protein n=1 Tax=Nocardioides sp. TaxID=35761 RepID=UPI0035AED13A
MTCRLLLVPVTLREANAFVGREHRHHGPVVGHRISVGVGCEEHGLHGVAIGGRPVARGLDDGISFEVTRCCTDGTPNACSKLYGAMRRAAINLGYPPRRIFTYTLATEEGRSLHAAGWVRDVEVKAETWARPNRERVDKHPTGPKTRWRAA